MKIFSALVVVVSFVLLTGFKLEEKPIQVPGLVDAGAASQPASQPTATPIPQADSVDPVWLGEAVVKAFKGHAWREGAALLITLIVFLWRRFASKLLIGKLSSWWIGLLTVAASYLAAIPQALTATGFSWGHFIWTGLLTSAEAMLLWQMVGKKLLPKVFGEAAPQVPPAA